MRRYTGSRIGVPQTLRTGILAFAMVCQNPKEAQTSSRKINYKLFCLHRKVSGNTLGHSSKFKPV